MGRSCNMDGEKKTSVGKSKINKPNTYLLTHLLRHLLIYLLTYSMEKSPS